MHIMKKLYFSLIVSSVFGLWTKNVQGQSLAVGSTVLEDYYRRKQLLGELDSTISFSVRPLYRSAVKVDNIFDP